MVPLVHRRWRTSFGADAPQSSTGAIIDGAKDRRRPHTRRPRPIPSHSHHFQKEYGRGVARERLSQRMIS